jgi:hypothetical protein
MVLLRCHAVVITSARGHDSRRLHVNADMSSTARSLSGSGDGHLHRAPPLMSVEAAPEHMSDKGECGPLYALSAPPAVPLRVRARAVRRATLRSATLVSVEK